MNKFLSLLGIFIATSASAQLTVKQDGSSETYIYVTDQVLYVADKITVNKDTESSVENAKAGIYLRDEAQLIQGNDVQNEGTGFISVYQDSRSDSYDYNYWASPVSNAGSNLFTLAGSIYDATDVLTARTTVFQNIGFHNGQGRSGLDYSVDTQLKISPTWLYSWNVDTQRWAYIGANGGISGTNGLLAGQGFLMKGTNVTTQSDGTTPLQDANNQYYEFRGRPNNGTITVPINTTSVTGSQAEIGENLNMTITGNPYPSALDLGRVFFDSDNYGKIHGFYFYDEDRSINSHYYTQNASGYAQWSPVMSQAQFNELLAEEEQNGISDFGVTTQAVFYYGNNNGTQSGNSNGQGNHQNNKRRFVPVAQGFVIGIDYTQNISGSDITLKNEHRAYVKEDGENSLFRRPFQRSMTRFHVIFNDYSHVRDMVLNFSEYSSNGYDFGMDAVHPMDAVNQEAYFTIQNDGNGEEQRNLVIQSVPFDMNMSIPIAFKLNQQGRVRIKAAEELNVPYYRVLLLDTQDNMRYPINGQSSSIGDMVTAQLTLPAGTYENRFYIVFEDAPEEDPGHPDERSVVADDFDFVQDNRAKQLEVSNPEMYKVDEVNIYDMSGKLVYYAYGLGSASRYSFPTYNFADGVYMVRLVTENDGVVSYKMSVINR